MQGILVPAVGVHVVLLLLLVNQRITLGCKANARSGPCSSEPELVPELAPAPELAPSASELLEPPASAQDLYLSWDQKGRKHHVP